MRLSSSAFLAANSWSEMTPRWRSSSSFSICSRMDRSPPPARWVGAARPGGRCRSGRTCGSRCAPSARGSRSARARGADVAEVLLAVLAARLDGEVAGAEQPLEDGLAEDHVVDPLERDLDAVLGEHPAAEDQPVGGDHEVGGGPLDVADRPPRPTITRMSATRNSVTESGGSTATCTTRMPSTDHARPAAAAGSAKSSQCGFRSRTISSESLSSLRGKATGRSVVSALRRGRQPTELVEAGVADAEVVGDLVHHRDPHLVDDLGLGRGRWRRIGPPVDGDPVGHGQCRRSRCRAR